MAGQMIFSLMPVNAISFKEYGVDFFLNKAFNKSFMIQLISLALYGMDLNVRQTYFIIFWSCLSHFLSV